MQTATGIILLAFVAQAQLHVTQRQASRYPPSAASLSSSRTALHRGTAIRNPIDARPSMPNPAPLASVNTLRPMPRTSRLVPLAASTGKETSQNTVTWHKLLIGTDGVQCYEQTFDKKWFGFFYKSFRDYQEGSCASQGYSRLEKTTTKWRPLIGEMKVLYYSKEIPTTAKPTTAEPTTVSTPRYSTKPKKEEPKNPISGLFKKKPKEAAARTESADEAKAWIQSWKERKGSATAVAPAPAPKKAEKAQSPTYVLRNRSELQKERDQYSSIVGAVAGLGAAALLLAPFYWQEFPNNVARSEKTQIKSVPKTSEESILKAPPSAPKVKINANKAGKYTPGKPFLLSARGDSSTQTSIDVAVGSVVLIGLVVASGVSVAKLRRRRCTFTSDKEPLIAAFS